MRVGGRGEVVIYYTGGVLYIYIDLYDSISIKVLRFSVDGVEYGIAAKYGILPNLA